MERKLNIDLQDAIKWYNGDNKELRNLALEIFSKEELENSQWSSIRSWKDVLKALHISKDYTDKLPFQACYAARVQMIKMALNKGYDWKIGMDKVWYPYFRIGIDSVLGKDVLEYSEFVCGTVEILDVIYHPVFIGAGVSNDSRGSLVLLDDYRQIRDMRVKVGFLGCATKEIAEHFAKYFYFEILASCYGDKIHKVEEND